MPLYFECGDARSRKCTWRSVGYQSEDCDKSDESRASPWDFAVLNWLWRGEECWQRALDLSVHLIGT